MNARSVAEALKQARAGQSGGSTLHPDEAISQQPWEESDPDPDLPALPADFWTQRRTLAHIRDAAHSRAVSAEPVFAASLCRIASQVGRGTVVDTGIKVPARLNLFAGIVGSAGANKSTSMEIAAKLLPWQPTGWITESEHDEYVERGLGSGEGITEAFMGAVAVRTDAPGRPPKVRQQVRHNALLTADEGGYLVTALDRQGASLGPLLREAWSGSRMGQQNGSSDTSRDVRDHCLGIIVGFQPSTAARLLSGLEMELGTPQRFLWVPARTPRPKVRPQDPGELRWKPTGPDTSLRVPWGITEALEAADARDLTVPLVHRHRPLMTAKLAGLMAVLEQHDSVTQEDWELAEVLYAWSHDVLAALMAHAEEQTENTKQADREDRAKGAALSKLSSANVDMDRMRVARVLVRKAALIEVQHGRAATRRELKDATASRDRHLFQAALDHALRGQFALEQREGETGYRAVPPE